GQTLVAGPAPHARRAGAPRTSVPVGAQERAPNLVQQQPIASPPPPPPPLPSGKLARRRSRGSRRILKTPTGRLLLPRLGSCDSPRASLRRSPSARLGSALALPSPVQTVLGEQVLSVSESGACLQCTNRTNDDGDDDDDDEERRRRRGAV
ncbi:Hypothetical predicted protein, partial [Olea europaea subsp. europaea]